MSRVLCRYYEDFFRGERNSADLAHLSVGFRLARHLELGELPVLFGTARPPDLHSTTARAFAAATRVLRNRLAHSGLGFKHIGKVAEKLRDVGRVDGRDADKEKGEGGRNHRAKQIKGLNN